MITLHTPRLRLRPPDASDVRTLMDIHQDPDVVRYLGSGAPGDLAVAWRTVAMMIGHWHMRGYGPWVITSRTDGEILGRAGLWHAEGGPGVELGWMVRRSAWGQGIATEAARAALAWAWDHVPTDHVISVIHAMNAPSVRIAQKLGQRLESTDTVNGAAVHTYGIRRADASGHPEASEMPSQDGHRGR
jgi:RimJ/RimL family protein N-acetyltransferase